MAKIFQEYKGFKISRDIAHPTISNVSVDFKEPFSEVYHVTHLQAAEFLLTTKTIIPQLIKDESRLNTERIQVIWLSPNDWAEGSLYGNVRFTFDFNKIIKGKRFYAVEVMKKYNPNAFRILISEKDYSGNELLEEFEPTDEENGVWYRDPLNNNFFRKGYNFEFMLEDELNIDDAKRIDFVSHHKTICNIYKKGKCPCLGLYKGQAEMQFIINAISKQIVLTNLALHETKDQGYRNLEIAELLSKVIIHLEELYFAGTGKPNYATRSQIALAYLGLISKNKYQEAKDIIIALPTKEMAVETLKGLFEEYFQITNLKSVKDILGI